MYKKLSPKNDYIFKKIFGENKEKNKFVLKALLNAIFENEIVINEVEVENPIIDGKTDINKKIVLDIKAKLDNGLRVNIEMQLINQYNMIERSLYYWAKMYASSLDKGEDYSKLNKTIAINILDFILIKEESHKNKFHSEFYLKEKETNLELTDAMGLHFIEMPKFKFNHILDKNKAIDRWLLFLSDPKEEELMELISNDAAISEANNILYSLSSDKTVIEEYENREKYLRDEISRINGAEAKGRIEGKIETQKNTLVELLADGVTDLEKLKKYSGASEELLEEVVSQWQA